MNKQGRKSQQKILSLMNFQEEKNNKKIYPPHGMAPRARNLFKKIVAEYQSGTVNAEAVVLIQAFCAAETQHFLATKELQKHGAVITVDTKAGSVPRRNPWFDIMKTSAATMAGLLTKLRKSGMKPATTKKENARAGLMFQG